MRDRIYVGTLVSEKIFLAHHGILGQKWGVRHGPPYPLINKDFSTPLELSAYMKQNIEYSNFTKLKSPEQTQKDRKGSCHDQTLYELDKLQKMGKSPKGLFIIEVDRKTGQGGMTHSLAYWKEKGKVYYFENAWENHEGIKTFRNKNELIKYFVRSKRNGEFGNEQYTDLEFGDFSSNSLKPGMTLQQIVDKCLD